ncbi:hypothetical protein BDF22DRAFT_739788 [Syncephalis plumigaleata]|nr:hypothetical protein BDF22DRAFT_739788 [Syncephalis plumigaleata]
MRSNLGLTGVIATSMLLLASTTNATITTTDSTRPIPGVAPTQKGQPYQCKIATAPCAQTYVDYLRLARTELDINEQVMQSGLVQSQFYAGLQFAHANNLQIDPIPQSMLRC